MLGSGQFAMRKSIKGQRAVHPFQHKGEGEREDASGACAGDAVPAVEAAPPAVRVTLKSGDAGAQWQAQQDFRVVVVSPSGGGKSRRRVHGLGL